MKNILPIIGLEIHVELKTNSKMFCGCSANHFQAPPNSQTCPVCLGLPGALPVPNRRAVEWCIMLGLALGCKVPSVSKFDRKHYFYPDLSKGYQISQFDEPLSQGGKLDIATAEGIKTIRIRRVHMEEDTGKLQHATLEGKKVTLVDFNRSGVPLVEIVTEPDIRSGREAREFLMKLSRIVRYLDISDADMSRGSMRLEPNISVLISQSPANISRDYHQLPDDELPKYKVEVKNINSFRFVEKAIDFEIKRHLAILEKGQLPVQETRGFVESKGETVSQRTKEEAQDYRYFPEPDIPPMRFSKTEITRIKAQIPELPDIKKDRFIRQYGLSEKDAAILTENLNKAAFFEACIKLKKGDVKQIANYIINKKINFTQTSPKELVRDIVLSRKESQVDSAQLSQTVDKVISDNPKVVSDYLNGKEQALMFLIGQVKRILSGKGDAGEIIALIKKQIQPC